MTFDVQRVRSEVPALDSGIAFFDGPGGTQTPQPVIDAMSRALRRPLANRGLHNDAARNAEEIVRHARQAMADLTGGDEGGVVFGRSATALTFELSRTLARSWRPGDEVVVTRLDHDANIRPWVLAANVVGASVRWADFDPATGELPVTEVTALLSERTRLVAVTGASNLIGTVPELPAMAAATHAVGGWLYVDGVHSAAHALVDVEALGADFFVCSPYKFLGPHLGALVASPDVLSGLQPDKLLPATDAVPERFELGTLPYELLAGTTAAVDYLSDLAGVGGPRRHRLAASWQAVEQHERRLRRRVEEGLADRGAVIYSRAANRTSTVLFDLPGEPAPQVAARLTEAGVNAPAGSFYALEASRRLGLGDTGAVRVGLAPYSDDCDVDRLLAGLG